MGRFQNGIHRPDCVSARKKTHTNQNNTQKKKHSPNGEPHTERRTQRTRRTL